MKNHPKQRESTAETPLWEKSASIWWEMFRLVRRRLKIGNPRDADEVAKGLRAIWRKCSASGGRQ
jgi:hypothetical protein